MHDNLEKALDHLRHQESFQQITEEIRQRHADKVRDLVEVPEDQLHRMIGEVAAYQWIIDLFDGLA